MKALDNPFRVRVNRGAAEGAEGIAEASETLCGTVYYGVRFEGGHRVSFVADEISPIIDTP